MRAAEWTLRRFRSLGPYVAIELILPGGSIMALLLWIYRHRLATRQAAARIVIASYALWACFTVALFAASCANRHSGVAPAGERGLRDHA
jgi:hypothetical protein